MAKKRCFSTIRALRRLHPELLCAVLRKFPDYMDQRGIDLSAEPAPDPVPYEEIHAACMSGDIPHDLDDVLFFVSALGNTAGWNKIQSEAAFQGRPLNFTPDGYSAADLAMKAWLHDWPVNRGLLEQSFARAIIHKRTSYTYYVPTGDFRDRYRTPTAKALKALSKQLSDYFVTQGLGRGTNLVVYDFEKEIWFLIRYPGQIERYAAISDKGEQTSHVFKPEEYDAIVYHKEFGDLRLNTNRPQEHKRYRIDFGHLLLDASNVFSTSK